MLRGWGGERQPIAENSLQSVMKDFLLSVPYVQVFFIFS